MKKLLVCIAVVLLVLGCVQQNDPIQEEQSVSLHFMKPASIDIASAQCRVSADDMDTILAYLTVSPTLISGEVPEVPFGEDRLFEIMCYNSSGNMNYYGSALTDISNIAPTVNISLYQVDSTADVTIIGTFGDEEETEEKIVFTADWDGDVDVYIMDTDGTNIRQLTNAYGIEDYPRLSPDRSKVLFHRGIGDFHPQPYIVDVETLEETHISGLSAYDPQCMSWHPTEDKIVFHTSFNSETADIYSYDFSTGAVTPLIVNASTNWVPLYIEGGEKLLYYSNMSGIFKAYIANADGSNPVMVRPDETGEQKRPHMNPVNNNQIAIAGRGYSQTSYSQWGIFVIDRADSSVTNVISTDGIDERGPIWSPDGSKIMYERNSGGNYGIYVINPDGSGNKAVLDTPNGREGDPHWR